MKVEVWASMHKALLSLLLLNKDPSFVVLDMNEEMEQISKLRRQGKKFQEKILFQVHLLKKAIKVKVQELLLKVQSLQHARLVFNMNTNV
jgi:hypothetical protein